ncbi:hypothetical protein CLV51_101331 [Chitinophaga niastensis]|uniref:Fibronectin type-III domain-containing protein n=1 Tax=Chitinophaga niastensis TaxID=536980 RepID=A0A2P8HRZ8_CHINA|nr:hypothetical protein [Chitinophaga niastensis]PSL49001.1 hypothetical protein CLV51_101331 [Chitinophaga niastensis]
MLLKTFLPAFLAITLITFSSCKKKKRDNPAPNPQEEALKFELPDVQEGKYNMALDSTFTFKVNITTKIPDKGVGVTLNVVTETGNIPLAQDAVPDVTANPFSITLHHLKPLKTYAVTVTLASFGNTANTATPKVFYITNKSNQ